MYYNTFVISRAVFVLLFVTYVMLKGEQIENIRVIFASESLCV